MEPATKQDLDNLEARIERKIEGVKNDLESWMLNREVQSIRWFVGTQLAYVVITLGAMYFMLSHALAK